MSAPAAKARSLPVSTIAPTPSSASAFASASPSSFMSASLSALSTLGRLSVISVTRPRVSTRMLSYGMGLLGRDRLILADPCGDRNDRYVSTIQCHETSDHAHLRDSVSARRRACRRHDGLPFRQ